MKSKILAIITTVFVLAAVFALAACSSGFSAEEVSKDHIIAKADSKASGNKAFEIEVDDQAKIEISAYVDDGSFEVHLANGKDVSFGTFEFGANSEVHRVVEVDPGTVVVEIHADHATGTVEVQPVYIEDDPKVARS